MTRWVDGIAILVWNCFAWVMWATAIVEVVRTPAERFARGWRTKLGRLAIILMLSCVVGGLYLPVGAAVVLAGLRRTRRQANPHGPTPPGPELRRCQGGFLPPEEQ